MISYAQNREDVLLARVFRGINDGFYVDVGANHPTDYSITRHFYNLGWRGINIEPGNVFELLARERPQDLCLNVAASDREGTVTFYEFPAAHGLSTLTPELSEHVQPHAQGRHARIIPARTLRGILEEHPPGRIDFMSIDVEGHETQVIRGNDWDRFRPRVLLVEATLPMTRTPCHQEWEPLLLAAGYVFAYFDGLNRFYVPREHADLLEHFQCPVNVFDHYVPVETARLQGVIDRLEAHTRQSEADRVCLRDEIMRLNRAIVQMEELERQGELDRTRLRCEARRLNQVLGQVDGLARQSHAERVRLHGEIESLHALLRQLGGGVRRGEGEHQELRAELQRLAQELEGLRGVSSSLHHLQGVVGPGGALGELRDEIEHLKRQLTDLVQGTGRRSFRLGLTIARGVHWLARRLPGRRRRTASQDRAVPG